ncbi:MAG TPA: hypothetical protein VL201_01545 [Patescibacteria group bacterium]|nr:hypothetical protein [Patescibacteria group bacterium]
MQSNNLEYSELSRPWQWAIKGMFALEVAPRIGQALCVTLGVPLVLVGMSEKSKREKCGYVGLIISLNAFVLYFRLQDDFKKFIR